MAVWKCEAFNRSSVNSQVRMSGEARTASKAETCAALPAWGLSTFPCLSFFGGATNPHRWRQFIPKSGYAAWLALHRLPASGRPPPPKTVPGHATRSTAHDGMASAARSASQHKVSDLPTPRWRPWRGCARHFCNWLSPPPNMRATDARTHMHAAVR